ncbi:MAG: hypothetical protein ABJQ29_10015 [Luteolibacter sp.]
MKTPKKTLPSAQRGFALIATLTLMVLLVVVALGILSLSTIQLRAVGHNQAQAEARANAKLGLQLAIGRLQRTLGPDARATAKASILDTDPSTDVIDGVPNSSWLGAYPTINPSSPDDGLLKPRDLRDWSLANMEWLVSSSDVTGNPNPKNAITGEAVTMAQYIDDASVTVPDTTGINSLPAAGLSKAQAGLVKVRGNSGRYAWWVSDESMKARIDTLASENGSDVLAGSQVDADAQKKSNYQIIQGTDLSEQLPDYKDSAESMYKLVTHSQLERLGEESGATWKNWSKLNQDKFTPYSASLPVDVAHGMLKKDLTAYLKGSYSGLEGKSMIDSRFSLSAGKVPSFDLLKQWANLVTDRDQPQVVVAPDDSSSPPQLGLYPTITQAAVAMQHSYKILSMATYTMQPVVVIQPQIQLWNPHNVDLAAQDYIVQIGYQFKWSMRADGTKNSDKFAFTPTTADPEWRSWTDYNGVEPLPVHKLAANEKINYQGNKRFFTFVIKNQAFKAGESLIFYPKAPSTGPISGVPYNMKGDADTDILKNYSSEADLNLLVNEGSLDEFFYFVMPMIGTAVTNNAKNRLANAIGTESNFWANTTGAGVSSGDDLDIHANLYVAKNKEPSLLHALKIPQHNFRNGLWRTETYPLNRFQNGEVFARDTYEYKSPLINLGSSILASNFDIFQGGSNINRPPKGGQPHSYLNLWNIRCQEAFAASASWGTAEGTSWMNAFSFRDVNSFKQIWEITDNLYTNLSTDRLGGWHQSGVQRMVYPFFDYPTGEFGPMSLGTFQHANLSVYSWQPTYAFGNAQAPARLGRTEYKSSSFTDLYDISYLLNASTWDSYYLSTIPQSGTTLEKGMRLPNSRQYLESVTGMGDLNPANLTNSNGYDLSASNVLIHGGFNVNSTSKVAWKAFLSGAMGQSVETEYSNADSNVQTAAAMGRFLAPMLEEPSSVAADRDSSLFTEPNSWGATRTLNASEIDSLAKRLVEEVKRRGPFLSLADFVNRRLDPDSTATGEERTYQQLLGTLQAAINKATLIDKKINHHYYANHGRGGSMMRIKPLSDWSTLNFDVTQAAQEAMFGYPVSKIDSDGGLIHSYSPNFLSQADVLTKIGPSITVRGDTYVIRSYGDATNSKGDVTARAWCEAVVQRVAEPVGWDGSNAKLMQPQAPGDTGFGRRFRVVSFRWLDKKDVMPYENDLAITK